MTRKITVELDKEQDREAFEKAVTVEGLHTNLTRIGPADSRAGEYAHTIVQTCWHVWQLALAYAREQEAAKEMSEQEQTIRNTHFAGWAKAVERKLYEEHLLDVLHLGQTALDASDAAIQILAKAGYDLVKHTIENVSIADLDMLLCEECVQRIPDLVELPEEEREL